MWGGTLITSNNLDHTEVPIELIELPPFSAVAVKVLQAASNDFSQFIAISDLISSDAVFAGAILRIVNSPLYAIRAEIASISEATMLLGMDRIKGAALTIGIRAYLNDALEAPAIKSCWRHSLACAVIAGELARGTDVKEDVAYTAGVIHDIGRLALAVAYPQRYPEFQASVQNEPCDVLGREREVFGIDHCQAGCALVSRWKLPESFIAVTSRHHEPVTEKEFDLLAIICASCMTADALGFDAIRSVHTNYEDLLPKLSKKFRSRLPLDPQDLTFRIAFKINSMEST